LLYEMVVVKESISEAGERAPKDAFRALVEGLAVCEPHLQGLKWAYRYLEESYELAVRALEQLGLQRFLDLYEKLEDSYVECAVGASAKRDYRLKLGGWRSGISLGASLRGYYNLKKAVKSAVELKQLLERISRDLERFRATLEGFEKALRSLGIVEESSS
jgi:tetratricopeptide (TPR) repeat protein